MTPQRLWEIAPILYVALRARGAKIALDQEPVESIVMRPEDLDKALVFAREQMSDDAFAQFEALIADAVMTPTDEANAAVADRRPRTARDAARQKLMAGDDGFRARFPNASRIKQL